MCRYPPSTINKYLGLPSTQRIQTHTSHRHNTTPPLSTLVQAPYTHHRSQNTDTCPTLPLSPQDWLSPNPILSSTHPPLHPHRPEPNTYTCHALHQHLSLHSPQLHLSLHSPQPHLLRPPHQHCCHPRTLTAHTHNTNNSTCITVTTTTALTT